jgi:hypothetical protein
MFGRPIAAVVHIKAGFRHFVMCASDRGSSAPPLPQRREMPGFIHELVCIAL